MHNYAKRNICNSILKLKIQVKHNDRLKKGQVPKKKTIPATAYKTKRLFSLVIPSFSSSNIDFFNKSICTATTHLVA